jgi:esterase/lipase superfamily enzyme
MLWRLGAVLLCTGLLLAGCAARPTLALLEGTADSRPKTDLVTIYAASRQSLAAEGSSDDAVAKNGLRDAYWRYDITVPPVHSPTSGAIELPAGSGRDPSRYFTVRQRTPFGKSPDHFFEAIDAQAANDPTAPGDVYVYVHGFNVTYPEAVFRMAQLLHDSDTEQAAVLFSWPSFGRIIDYAADRERVMASRGKLETVLNGIANSPDVRRIHLVAHSMGSLLTMEALRQIKFKSHLCALARTTFHHCAGSLTLNKIDAIVLIEADIDLQVFKSQLDDICETAQPQGCGLSRKIDLVVTRDDLVLAASKRFAGGLARVGNADFQDSAQFLDIKNKGVRVIDLKEVENCDPFNHSNYTCVIAKLKKKIAQLSQAASAR